MNDLSKTTTGLVWSPIQSCPHCATRVDVSRFEPLQELSCPACNGAFAVQGQIDRFVLQSIAGRGGTGVVYRAHDPHLGRTIALKVVRRDKVDDEEVLEQMEQEAGVTASVSHPNVLRVYSVGTANGRFYIAMELVAGNSLDELLERTKKLSEEMVLELGIQAASGLQAAQAAGLVHRDIKPGNILFADARTAKVVDFGLAVFERRAAQAAGGEIWGTPYYLSPERLEGKAEDFRSDIFSLGATLFHALAGRPPYEAGTPEQVAMKRLQAPAPSVLSFAPGTSNNTAFVLKKMLERNRDERFSSYEELITSLRFALDELKRSGSKKARVVVDQTTQSKAGMWITLATIGVLVIGAGMVFMASRSNKPSVQPTVEVDHDIDPRPLAEREAEAAKLAGRQILTTDAATTLKPNTTANVGSLVPGTYIIRNRRDGKVININRFSLENSLGITMWDRLDGVNQKWIVKKGDDNTWRFAAFHNLKSMDVPSGLKGDNVQIVQYPPSGGSHQLFEIEQVEPSYYKITPIISGKALTSGTLSGENGGALVQRKYTGAQEQQWEFIPVGGLVPAFDLVDPKETVKPVMPTKPTVPLKLASASTAARFVPIDISAAATADSRTGCFANKQNTADAIRPSITGRVEVAGVPFEILSPQKTGTGKDQIILMGGQGQARTEYPRLVTIPGKDARLTRLHILGGVAAWGYPGLGKSVLGIVSVRICVERTDGTKEDIYLRNGIDICDFNKTDEVPGSARIDGFSSNGKQARYLVRELSGSAPVSKILIEGFEGPLAPVFFAITGETGS